MKKVEATIKPFKLDEVKEALWARGVQGITVSEVRGFSRQRGHAELYRGLDHIVDFLPRLKLEVIVIDEMAEDVVAVIAHAARTGRTGDGKILVMQIDDAIRIRTAERGTSAL